MVEPINHDGASTAATMGGKALKWGALGAIAAFAIPALVIGGGGILAGMAIAGMSTGLMGGLLSVVGAIVGVAGVVVGVTTGATAAATYGGTAAVAGAGIGLIRGGQQVSRENAEAHKRASGPDFSKQKAGNDREIAGIQKGYHIAMADAEPIMQQREQVAFIKGQESIIEQINAHVAANSPGQGKGPGANSTVSPGEGKPGGVAPGEAKGPGIGFADKEMKLQCSSRAELVVKKRDISAAAPKQLD